MTKQYTYFLTSIIRGEGCYEIVEDCENRYYTKSDGNHIFATPYSAFQEYVGCYDSGTVNAPNITQAEKEVMRVRGYVAGISRGRYRDNNTTYTKAQLEELKGNKEVIYIETNAQQERLSDHMMSTKSGRTAEYILNG